MAATATMTAAIINDDQTTQDIWSLQVEEAGYRPHIIQRPQGRAFTSVAELADEVERHARFAVFDHRLAQKGLAQFTGAQIVAELYDRHKTASLLVTTFEKIDKDTTIRLYRQKVPVLIAASEFDDPDVIRTCFDVCAREVRDMEVPSERRPWRTLVQIEDRDDESRIKTLDVLVPGWSTDTKVRFPLELIPPRLQAHAVRGGRFFARVNTGAQREEDLFFSEFELAPEPDPNDGLT